MPTTPLFKLIKTKIISLAPEQEKTLSEVLQDVDLSKAAIIEIQWIKRNLYVCQVGVAGAFFTLDNLNIKVVRISPDQADEFCIKSLATSGSTEVLINVYAYVEQ